MNTPEQIYIATLAERTTSLTDQALQELNTLEDEYTVILMSLDLQWRQTVQDLFTSMRSHLEGAQDNLKKMTSTTEGRQ